MAHITSKRILAAVLFALAWVLFMPQAALAGVSTTDSSKAFRVSFAEGDTVIYADALRDLVGEGTNIIGDDSSGARTITLQKDAAISDGVQLYGDITLDLNGHTLSGQAGGTLTQRQVFVAASSGDACNVVVKDSAGGGKIEATGFSSIFKTNDANATISIESGLFVLNDSPASTFVVESAKGDVKISGGTFVNLAAATRSKYAEGPGCVLTSGTSRSVSITGGTFMSASTSSVTICGTAGKIEIGPSTGKTVAVSGGLCAVYVEGGSAGTTSDPTPDPALTINGGSYASGKTVALTDGDYTPISATGITKDIALLVSTGEGNSTNKGKTVEALVKDGTFTGTTSAQLGSTSTSASNENSSLTIEKGTFAGSVMMGSNFLTTTTGRLTIKADPEVSYSKYADIDSAFINGFVLDSDGKTKLPLMESSVSFGTAADNLVYDGAKKEPKVSVTLGGHEASEGSDYTVTYANNVNAGVNTATATVTATATSSYAGSVVKTFTIKPKEFVTSGANRNTVVTLAQSTLPYCELSDDTGVVYYFEPEVTVAVDATVIDPSNYTISTRTEPTNYAGIVTITGKGNYSGTATAQCTVVKGVAVSFVDGMEDVDSEKRLIAVKAVFPYSASAVNSTGSTTPPAPPVHEGYAFAGWVGNYTQVTADSTVVARYASDPRGTGIVVSFVDPRNNNEIIKAEAVSAGGTATPPAEADVPKHDGYTFVGWTGNYSNVIASTTVQARYMAEGGHHVTFVDPLDGNRVIKSEVVPDGEAATAPTAAEMPQHAGYRHVGWDKSFAAVESDLQINATYEAVITHTVTFVDTMDNNKVILEERVNEGAAALGPSENQIPVHSGYNFAGWEGDFSKVTQDITVRTKWEKQPEPAQPAAGDMAVLTTVTREDGTKALRLLDGTGKPATGWLLVGGKWYVADDEGYARIGTYNVGSTTYVLGKDGVLQTGWVFLFDVNAWVYANPGTTGTYAAVVKGEWFWDGDGWYLASATGPIRIGWVEDENGYRYHLNDGTNGTFGKMDTHRWVLDKGSWYLVGGNGAVTSGWQWIDGDWYYLNPEQGGDYGKLMTGWFWDGSHWYWTNYSGKMLRNTWVASNGSWYYLGIDGSMRTGWQWIDGGWYYFGWNGVMYANRMTPDGCLTGPDGRWV